ncbi:exodeoxyribonuclease V subunit alpha [uncultured Paraglaciecola sp.]|uniref:exodeoxyribonuclease V subunit alpha n=1 Tax=uncultured Paraglaciecola sp. TaxID=1765024 RepID=UPI0030D8B2DF|tara:strand:- start:367 stop:2409 length:2043 start_codon:yes stop_codon:yes gene_type:complete
MVVESTKSDAGAVSCVEVSAPQDTPAKSSTTETILHDLLSVGRIRPLDAAFAEFIMLHEHNDSAIDNAGIHIIGLIAAYLSSRLGEQDSCLTLNSFYQPFLPYYRFGSPAELIGMLSVSTCVANFAADQPDAQINKPLILEGDELYMQRYWQYEMSLAEKINSMSGRSSALNIDEGRRLLKQLFGAQTPTTNSNAHDTVSSSDAEIDWQRVAVCLAASQNVSVITGGPGTGKTTTVIRLMALLQGLARHKGKRLQIKLAAPTGKAAARLSQSISAAMSALPETLQADLPTQCSTIHRLLGSVPNSPYFRFNEQHPLHVDVLIVDEASMVDLPLMSKLFAALPERAKIILLGDKDQLASVEAGSVLSDICSAALDYAPSIYNQPPPYSNDALDVIKSLCQIDLPSRRTNKAKISDSLALLHKSYRFSENSGIGRLARAINTGNLPFSKTLFADTTYPDITWNISNEPKALVDTLLAGYQRYFKRVQQVCIEGEVETQGTDVFALLQQQQVLCAQKEANWGVYQVNALIESELNKRGLIDLGRDFYIGRPIMLKQNDHSLGLFNGDIGIVMPDGQKEGLVKVWFVTEQGTLRGVLPSRLPPHETVYAMTIHKSQGSEFDHVYLCLPRIETRSQARLLSRELLYTGLTRAKKSFTLYSDEQALSISISRRCRRGSGLAKRLIR